MDINDKYTQFNKLMVTLKTSETSEELLFWWQVTRKVLKTHFDENFINLNSFDELIKILSKNYRDTLEKIS